MHAGTNACPCVHARTHTRARTLSLTHTQTQTDFYMHDLIEINTKHWIHGGDRHYVRCLNDEVRRGTEWTLFVVEKCNTAQTNVHVCSCKTWSKYVREHIFSLWNESFTFAGLFFFAMCFVLEDDPHNIYTCILDLLRGIVFVQSIIYN